MCGASSRPLTSRDCSTRSEERGTFSARRPFAHLPIRVRLAGTSALLTLFILCVFAVAIGTLTGRRIRADFAHQAAADATEVAARLSATVDLSAHRVTITPRLDLFGLPEHTVIRIVLQDGETIAQTGRAPSFGQPTSSPASADIAGYRVETRTIASNIGDIALQYARPLSDVDNTVARVKLFLIIGVLAGSGLALVAGLMIASRAMAPITELTAAAREIERTRDPNQSIPRSPSNDEVAELAATLDGMLRALSDARTETEGMLARQREFVADASHELRTPLTSVLANLELLVESLDGEEAGAARSALRSSQRMRRLVEDLLLLARADVGRKRPHAPLDLAEVVVEAAAELGPAAREHDLSLDARPTPMLGARDDLHRVVINLIENALRHTPAGTQVRVETHLDGDGCACLIVEDDGPGIPDALRPRLFERFVRGSGDRGGSFGLGLAIVHAVSDAHEGTVRVERSPSGGARFVVSLSARDTAAERAPVLARRS